MANAEQERMLDEWAKAWSAHDTEGLVALFTDDCLYEDVTMGVVNHGKEELRSFANQTFVLIPDFKLQLTSRFVGGDWGVIEWVTSGTPTGDVLGMPATGKSFSSLRAVTVVEFRAGKIHRNSDYWDFATAMRQMGQLPAV
jgi:steroid delta-isomerase-like uncharacterized protein